MAWFKKKRHIARWTFPSLEDIWTSTWRIPYWWRKMAEIHWAFLIGCYLRGKSSTPNNNQSERPSGFLHSDVVIMEFPLAFAHVFPRFASASCNSSFDWLLDYLCLLWLARVFSLLLVLQHSVESRSIAYVFLPTELKMSCCFNCLFIEFTRDTHCGRLNGQQVKSGKLSLSPGRDSIDHNTC